MKIERVGADTYIVKSETSKDKEYMVYNSLHEGFTCTCMWWSIHCRLRPPHPLCKHIRAVFKTFRRK